MANERWPGGGARILMPACAVTAWLLLGGLASGAAAASVVTGQMVLATSGAHAGSAVTAALVAEIEPGYHINDHVPSLDYLIPTILKLDGASPLAPGTVAYPKGTAHKFAFLDTPISVYEGKLVVKTEVRVAAGTKPGEYTLKGTLSYQACNDHACFPPTSLPVTLEVKVVPHGVALKNVNSDVFRGAKPN